MIRFFGFEKFGFKEGFFMGRQHEVNLFLIGCSAIKNDRSIIIPEDILTAYKTLFKIIKTDISKLINGTPKQEISHGYLYCQECDGYYQLQPNESPDDFTDKCECGGHLEYKENLED